LRRNGKKKKIYYQSKQCQRKSSDGKPVDEHTKKWGEFKRKLFEEKDKIKNKATVKELVFYLIYLKSISPLSARMLPTNIFHA